MTTTPKRDRYIVSNLNGKFQVTDGAVTGVQIMNDKATNADNTDPGQMRYFGMSYEDALALKADLNDRYNR